MSTPNLKNCFAVLFQTCVEKKQYFALFLIKLRQKLFVVYHINNNQKIRVSTSVKLPYIFKNSSNQNNNILQTINNLLICRELNAF